MKLLTLMLLAISIKNINSACLSKEILEGLGFTGIKTEPEKLD